MILFTAKAVVCLAERCGFFDRRKNPVPLTAVLSGFLFAASVARTKAESRADYRYEDYAEEGGRIHVATQGAYFDASLRPWLSLKGNYIHDVISGATPTGAPPIAGQTTVAKATIDDIRNAGFLEAGFQFANQTLTPQLAYSEESDYRSIGISLNDAIDFNDKNTTLLLGASHAFDEILPNPGESITRAQAKNNTDVLVGVTQLLGPATLAAMDLTIGYADGFLSDPYKRVLFDDFPYNPGQPFTVWPEKRPNHKLREVLFFSLNHSFEKANGALEATYRLHHDDFGVLAHTLSLQWNQKLGPHVILSPIFRYYRQTAASFYATHFPGDPTNPAMFPLPKFYSADYRLSALETFTYGVSLTVRVRDRVSIELSAKRYQMRGTDGVTAAHQYPTANVFSGGVTLCF